MKKTPSVMVCVTTQRACERLIEAGAKAAEPSSSPLHVVHVAGSHQHFFNMEDEGAALEYLFAASKRRGADMADRLIRFKSGRVTQMTTNASPLPSSRIEW